MAAPLEAELGLPVYDSTALGVWHALRLCGVDCRPAAALWGSLFAETL
jgi:maleate isomerase